jgi:hypothetical protein
MSQENVVMSQDEVLQPVVASKPLEDGAECCHGGAIHGTRDQHVGSAAMFMTASNSVSIEEPRLEKISDKSQTGGEQPDEELLAQLPLPEVPHDRLAHTSVGSMEPSVMNFQRLGQLPRAQFPIGFIINSVCDLVSHGVPEARRSDPHFRKAACERSVAELLEAGQNSRQDIGNVNGVTHRSNQGIGIERHRRLIVN